MKKTFRWFSCPSLWSAATLAWALMVPASAGAFASELDSARAVEILEQYLTLPQDARAMFAEQTFLATALTKKDAELARELLWSDYLRRVRENRAAEVMAKAITLGAHTMRYEFKTFGERPAEGRSLYISMHGGGGAPAYVNDQQWRNQINLYQPDEGIYLAPRAPTDTWNLWHEEHIDPLFDRLITNMAIFHEVNINRVYLMGYSAGGDGVYQLAPRMADRLAAAAMSAGHPNEASPFGLRNIGFTIHVGALDTAYKRNTVALEWGQKLDELAAADRGAYPHTVHSHAGLGHWMELRDAVALPWMAQFKRQPLPHKVAWHQDDVLGKRFYWLAVGSEGAQAGDEVLADVDGQRFTIKAAQRRPVKILLNDQLVDLDKPITVVDGEGRTLFEGEAVRTIACLLETSEDRGDRELTFSAEIEVQP